MDVLGTEEAGLSFSSLISLVGCICQVEFFDLLIVDLEVTGPLEIRPKYHILILEWLLF